MSCRLSFIHSFDNTYSQVGSFDKAKEEKEKAEKELKDNPNLTTNQIDKLEADIVKSNDKITQMQNVGLLVDTINGALYSPADNALGTVANTLSPKIVYEIGQQFKGTSLENTTSHYLAQALVGAVTAGLAGNDALLAGLSSRGAEALAPHLARYLGYINDDQKPSDMSAEQKQTVSAIISLGAAAIGATSGSVTDMVASGEAGAVAVEENALTQQQASVKFAKEVKKCMDDGGTVDKCSKIGIIQTTNKPDSWMITYDIDKYNRVHGNFLSTIGEYATITSEAVTINGSPKILGSIADKVATVADLADSSDIKDFGRNVAGAGGSVIGATVGVPAGMAIGVVAS